MARLVGDAEDSALFRLKEECHALFRLDDARPRTEVQAEELFDLAVGALFHETMKFREGFYLTDTLRPAAAAHDGRGLGYRVRSPTPSGACSKAGSRRMLESEAEAEQLFRETRDQLLIVLRQLAASGAVARSLVEDAPRAEQVFGMPLARLLADIYGSAARGYQLAIDSLIENGHYAEAAAVLEHPDARAAGVARRRARLRARAWRATTRATISPRSTHSRAGAAASRARRRSGARAPRRCWPRWPRASS